MLETQIHRLKSLNQANKTLQEKRQQLDDMQETVRKQLAVADSIQRNLLRPPPSQKNQKVVMIQSAMNG
jgi:t-SNARE complex subunit (syntaxin)